MGKALLILAIFNIYQHIKFFHYFNQLDTIKHLQRQFMWLTRHKNSQFLVYHYPFSAFRFQ